MSISVWQCHLQDHPFTKKQYDLVVIGAGITGVSAAYWFRKHQPSASILIIDKGELGYGATGKNAGFVTCGSIGHYQKLLDKWGQDSAAEIWRFSEANHALMKEHLDLNEKDHSYRQCGSLSLASTDQNWSQLQLTAKKMNAAGIQVSAVPRANVQTQYGLNDYEGGIFYPLDGCIHPLKALHSIFNYSNADMLAFCETYRLKHTKDCNIIYTNKGTIKSNYVIVATNGYTKLLDHPKLPKITPHRGQVLVTTPVHKQLLPVCYSRETLTYFRQLPNRAILVGGFRQLNPEAETTLADELNHEIQLSLEKYIAQHLNIQEPFEVQHRWSGIMGFTEDEKPKIVEIEPRILFVGGYSGHGMGLAFHIAKNAIDFLGGQPLPNFIRS